jgi:hypothetical protein
MCRPHEKTFAEELKYSHTNMTKPPKYDESLVSGGDPDFLVHFHAKEVDSAILSQKQIHECNTLILITP